MEEMIVCVEEFDSEVKGNSINIKGSSSDWQEKVK